MKRFSIRPSVKSDIKPSVSRPRNLLIFTAALILAAIMLRVAVGFLFHAQESEILEAARQVSSPMDLQTFVAKHHVIYRSPKPPWTGHECYDYSKPAPLYVHLHYFTWDFDQTGRRTSYYRKSYRQIFGMEFTRQEAIPGS